MSWPIISRPTSTSPGCWRSPALAQMGLNIGVPPLGAQEFEIADRRLRTQEQHQLCAYGKRPAGLDEVDRDAGLRRQGIEIVEIADPG